MTQVRGRTGVTTAVLAAAVLAVATPARAGIDVSASYQGSLSKARTTADIAAVLSQAGSKLTGTVAVESADGAVNGVFAVTGRVAGRNVKFGGRSGEKRFKWSGRAVKELLKGKGRWRGVANVSGPVVLVRGSGQSAQPREACDNPLFSVQVMGRVLKPICANCHVAGGAAKDTALRVDPADPIATEKSVNALIDVNSPRLSRILQKPLAEVAHGGGQQLASNTDEWKLLEQWVNLVAVGQQCDSGAANVKLVPMKATDLLVRAAMDTLGQRPAIAELDWIAADPNAYEPLVDRYLHSAEFLDRVKDLYDDALLVRREDDRDESLDETWSIYGEALELIAYIVQNDRPLTEMGTADYTVANSLLQRDTGRMPYPMDRVASSLAWEPVRYTDGRPHAGVLSTNAFYEVWDTNDTNKNRRRANRVSILFHCYNFLDTPVDVTRNVDNNDANAVLSAVTTRADCKACHDRLDPLASFLFKMDNAGLEDQGSNDFYNGNGERWRSANKRPPAVYGQPGTDVRDMGRLLVQHPKFAECQTKRAFKMLFLRDPISTEELTTAADIAQKWVSQDGYNFRALVKRWMMSPAYRGRPETHDPAWVRRVNPERFELVIRDLTGFVWTRPAEDNEDDADPNSDPPRTEPVPLLTKEKNGFRIILGSINGVSVSARSYSLNASVAMVQRKVAALAADWVVQHDLAMPDGTRKLLNGVTGAENPATDAAAIRAAITRLGKRLYGEQWGATDASVGVWFNLYSALYADSSQAGTGSGQVPGVRGERAWRGLLTGMLRSPRLLLY